MNALKKNWVARVIGWWVVLGFRLHVRVMIWKQSREFVEVARMPREDALQVLTKWRWDMSHSAVDEELQDAYLRAIGRLEAHIKGKSA